MALRVAKSLGVLALAAVEGHAAAEGEDTDIGYNLLVSGEGVGDVARTCYKIPQLPSEAMGSFFQSGPGKFELGGYEFKAFLDGYTRTNRIELGNGELCHTAKFLNTSYYGKAQQLGRICNGPTFMGSTPDLPWCPLKDPLCFIEGIEKDNNYVSLLPVAGEALLLTDSPLMVRFNYETMDTYGTYNWSDGGMSPSWMAKDHMGMTGSAHPLRRPGREDEYVALVVEKDMIPVGPQKAPPVIGIYSINVKTLTRSFIGQVPVNSMQFLHSYGVSQNYVVLPLNADFDPNPLATELLPNFKSDWNGVRVLNMNTQEVQSFQTDMFYHSHVINTFENATGIVMDLNTWENVPFNPHEVETSKYANKTERDLREGAESIERMHLHLEGPLKGQITRQVLSAPGRVTDFMRINDLVNGKHYCIYYAVEWFHDDKTHASMAVLKHDICQGTKTYWAKEHQYPHEPFFIPLKNVMDADTEVSSTASLCQSACTTPGQGKDQCLKENYMGWCVPHSGTEGTCNGAHHNGTCTGKDEFCRCPQSSQEDHGLIVFLVLNGPRAADDFVILDAKTFEEIAVVQLDARSPFLAHGQFVPKAAQEAVKTALAVEHPQLAAAIDMTFLV